MGKLLQQKVLRVLSEFQARIANVKNNQTFASLSENLAEIVQRLQQAVDFSEANLGSDNPNKDKSDESAKTLSTNVQDELGIVDYSLKAVLEEKHRVLEEIRDLNRHTETLTNDGAR